MIRLCDPGEQSYYGSGRRESKDTTDLLKEYGIGYVGAGDNISEACRPYIIGRNGIRVGIYACAEHEFSIAGPETPGQSF